MLVSVWCVVIVAEQLAIERQKLFEAIGYSEGGPKEEYPHEVSLLLLSSSDAPIRWFAD